MTELLERCRYCENGVIRWVGVYGGKPRHRSMKCKNCNGRGWTIKQPKQEDRDAHS